MARQDRLYYYYVWEDGGFCFARMACRRALGRCMAVCRTQDAVHADIESHTARTWSLGHPGNREAHRQLSRSRFPPRDGGYDSQLPLKGSLCVEISIAPVV